MNNRRVGLAGFLLCWCCCLRLWAGGSGLNVVVVVNQNSTNSVQLGNYYCEKRQIPRRTWFASTGPVATCAGASPTSNQPS